MNKLLAILLLAQIFDAGPPPGVQAVNGYYLKANADGTASWGQVSVSQDLQGVGPWSSAVKGSCALSGLAVATCSAAIPPGLTVCALGHTGSAVGLKYGLSGTTLTIQSALSLDSGVVTYICM